MGSRSRGRRALLDSELCGTVLVLLSAAAVLSLWMHGRSGTAGKSIESDYTAASVFDGDGQSTRDTTPALVPKPLVNSIGMRLSLVPPGEFRMGSPESEELRKTDELPHQVRITRPFYMGVCEVTVGQYRRFAEETGYRTESEKAPPDEFTLDGNCVPRSERTWLDPGFAQADEHPVVYVSWHDALAFCRWLSAKEGRQYRLPTEAEWEYACRAGTATRFSCGDAPSRLFEAANVQPWVRNKQGGVDHPEPLHRYTTPAGAFRPNAFGLCDMHGNVWEWCSDWYDREYYAHCETNDPQGPVQGEARVVRGGSFRLAQWSARSATRSAHLPAVSWSDVGFRVVAAERD